MYKLTFVFITLLIFGEAFGQRDKSLPSISGTNATSDTDYVNLKSFVLKTTNYLIDKHPLLWAKEQVETNLLKTDTLLDTATKRQKIYYYSKDFGLFQILTKSIKPGNLQRGTKVYDTQNNIIFDEWLDDQTNTIKRIRRGYDENNIMVFECTVWQEVGIGRLIIMRKFKKPFYYKGNVCNCDF